jgi:hypothetical protein
VLDRDLLYLHYPMKAEAARQWLDGRLPEWDPGTLNGQPLAANPNYAAFYPATPALAGADPIGAGSRVLAAHHLWLLIGFLLLAHRVRATPLGTALGGLAVSLSGPLLSTLPYYNLLVGVSWAPWLAVATTLRTRRARVVASAAAIALSLLAGSPDAAFACLCTAAVWLATRTDRSRPAALAELAAAAAAGAAAAAVQLLPAALLFKHTLRAVSKPYAESLGYHSFHPLRTLELVVPRIFGNPAGTLRDEFWGSGVVDPGGPLLDSAYFGLTVVTLCVLALARRQLALAGAAAFCIAVACGRHLGLHPVLVTLLPPLAQLRYPEKYLLLVPLLLSLALLEIELPAAPSKPRLAAAVAAACGLALFGLLGAHAIAASLPAAAGHQIEPAAAAHAVHHTRVGFLVAALWVAVTTIVMAAPIRDVVRCLALAAVVASDLLAAQLGGSYQLTAEKVAAEPELVTRLRADGCRRLYHMALDDVGPAPPAAPASYTEFAREALYPRCGTLYGVRYALDPPVDLMETVAVGREALAAQRAGGADLVTLQALGVSHVLHADPRPPFKAASTIRTSVGYLSRLGPGTPLWFVADDGSPPVPADVTGSNDALAWELRAPASGVLATDISFAPGWTGTVDGRPVAPTATDLGMVAIRVEPTTSGVRLHYRTPGLAPGLAVSAAAWIALASALLAATWRSRRR